MTEKITTTDNGEHEPVFTPREVVSELDRYIVGQHDAKKAVAIALRNRWRRRQVPPEFRDDILPKNIIMIGPTGVGKTEIARRLARLSQAPFLKVEASKFTEVGYVGRDVDSMIRDLVEIAVKMLKDEETKRVEMRAAGLAEERLLDLLIPPAPPPSPFAPAADSVSVSSEEVRETDARAAQGTTRDKFRQKLREGKLDDRYVELDVATGGGMAGMQIFGPQGMEEMMVNLQDMIGNMSRGRQKKRKVRVPEALKILSAEEASKLVDMEKVTRDALERAEQSGIVFLDEIDKIAGRERGHGPDISREGVQRDLLPIVEGSKVVTKYGIVNTDHILFIAAGAFNVSKPSDLIPELQGRFPIRVELQPLGKDEFVRILREPKNSLINQYVQLLATEGIVIEFADDAVTAVADIAHRVNSRSEDIGARRLHTVMEKLLEEISFSAPEMKERSLKIDADYVAKKLEGLIADEDLSKYIL